MLTYRREMSEVHESLGAGAGLRGGGSHPVSAVQTGGNLFWGGEQVHVDL